MNSDLTVPRNAHAILFKIIAWVFWSIFLLVSLGLFAFARAVRNDVYFERYYSHHPMNQLTVVMTTFPIWMVLLPLLWLPFVMAYQRQPNPKGILLLPLIASMFMGAMVIFILILCSGPPIQM